MPATPKWIIRAITIQPEGVALEYMGADTDLRPNGLQLQHVLFVPSGESYDDEIDTLLDAAHHLLADALQDMDLMEPVELTKLEVPVDDDEED